ANTAPIKWAQRSDSLYVTISLPDVKSESITLTDDKLVFTGTSGANEYACDFEFFKGCDAEKSTYKVLPRSVQMFIVKAEEEEEEVSGADEFWPRLLKDKAKEKNQVKIDWDKYVDEDEEEEAGGFDTSGLEGGQGMGGMPGMGGMGGPGGPGGGMGGMPPGMGGMPGMGGEGGMGGMEEMMAKMKGDLENKGGDEGEDSDDDDLPDLEES
ncbi:hypothetical protein TL16_g03092, partial [Triparma laevis f. inornata]